MNTLFFDKDKHCVYNAIKWAAENSTKESVRYACDVLLLDGKPSAFGYELKVNEHYKEQLVYALSEYLNYIQNKS